MSAKAKNKLTPQQRKATLNRVLHKIRPYSAFVVCSLLVAAVSVAAQLYIPILCGDAIDKMLGKGNVDLAGVLRIAVSILVVAAVAALAQWLLSVCNNRITFSVSRDLRIRSNLLWGNKDATDADLWAALETAQAADFVRAKPLGLDEPVEQGGRNLSGGQKQRLTIARALVGKPDILILDDSASALDYATDAALRKALAALPGALTVFIVSQRAASLQHADQILVLDDGHLVGIGTHSALRSSCPVYEEIYESQFKKGEAEA